MKVHPLSGYELGASAVRMPGENYEPWPIRLGGSTGAVGKFGMTRNGGTKMHKGLDLLAAPGAPIYAAGDGTITRAGESTPHEGEQDGRRGYGYRVYLEHDQLGGDGAKVQTRYAHLSTVTVEKDQHVRAGELIGFVGRSGNVDGECPTHLHFEVRLNGNPYNPEDWLKP